MINRNNIGFMRLLLAYAVIFSHSSQLIDGNKSRDILYQLTGTISLGEVAVNGFFIISGYLIAQSYENSRTIYSWLVKRVLRIYPAFIVAWLVCMFLVIPLAGAPHLLEQYSNADWLRTIVKIVALSVPHVDGLKEVTNISTINGSLWTIRYEFISYLLIPLIAYFGLSKKNIFIAFSLSIALFFYAAIAGDYKFEMPFRISIDMFARLTSAFFVGMLFYKFKEKIVWNHFAGAISIALILLLASDPNFSRLVINIFGGYLLFNLAFNYKNKLFENINNSYDISYGVYIYAWPIQILLLQNNPALEPWEVSVITVLLSSIAGYISWILIEKPFMGLKRYLVK